MNDKILLTFDLEEFDLPLEYGQTIDKTDQMAVTNTGLNKLLPLLKRHGIRSTFFTTAHFAESCPLQIARIVDEGHEIASHLYYHSEYGTDHLLKSKLKLELVSKQVVTGFRSPRLKKMDLCAIARAGYAYDSSLNPTYIPGRYNNFRKPRKFHKNMRHNLFVVPMSVALFIRFPLFWLSFKNIDLRLYAYLCKRTLKRDGVLNLYFHPWEFSDLDSYSVPRYIKRIHGDILLDRLENLILALKKEGEFSTMIRFIKARTSLKPT